MPVANDPLKTVYNRWDRFLNNVAKTVGQDRELDELSNKLAEVKTHAYADGALAPAELDAIHAKLELITKAYEQVAANRGYPVDKTLPTTKKAFEVYGENAQIHFQTFAGTQIKDGKVGGLLAELTDGLKGGKIDARVAKQLAFDVIASGTPQITDAKLSMLRGQLALVADPALQKAAVAAVRKELELAMFPLTQSGRALPVTLARFDEGVTFSSSVAVHKTTLPAEVRGTNQLFPNRPVAGWEASVRAATKAGFDDLSAAGKLFLDDDVKFPPGTTKNVAVKLDLNLGREGTPSVSDPASTAATITELLERSAKLGKTVNLTVGDSSGGENIPLGRTSMDITKDTGNFHMALKAGLQFAANQGPAGAPERAAAQAALGKIEAAEARGVYFGSKDDKASSKADQDAAVKAAAPWVKVVDYDVEGWKAVTPDLGPAGLALWGTKEFQIAKPWAEADFRVHVARGLSSHTLAAWTGAQKGLIGLHGFGLRPADQSGDKIGQDPVMLFRLLGGITGFQAMFARRAGMPDAIAKLFGAGGAEAQAITDKWQSIFADPKAGAFFKAEAGKLADELERDQKGGIHQVDVFTKMRDRTRAILEKADEMSPGFKQKLWDGAHDATRFAMQNLTREPLRQVIPEDSRDEAIGARIGVLTDLPYQSDLVIQSQAKIGVGGGPDAYREVRDVGHVAVGTNEAALDAVAWAEAKQPGNNWELNFPGLWATRLGNGPMNMDEITRL